MRVAATTWAVLLILSILFFGRGTHAYAIGEMSVTIFNQMPAGSSVTVRCQSADDNLGQHVLWPGQRWGFGFHLNLFNTTLFTCEFADGARHAAFIAWKFSRDAKPPWCRKCEWYVRPDGFWRAEEGTPAQLMQFWQ